MVLSRSIGVLSRGITSADILVLGFSAGIGSSVYDMYQIYLDTGGYCVITFPLAGLIHLIPAMSYSEIAFMKPCMGGPYHYAYNFLSEIAAFIVGWALILCIMAGVSFKLRYISKQIDLIFFNGALLRRNKPVQYLPLANVLSEHIDIISFVIALISAGMLSLSGSESKLCIEIFFISCLAFLTVLIQLGIGFSDYHLLWALHTNRLDLIFSSYSICSHPFVYVYLLTFLGEDTVDPARSLHETIGWLFYSLWMWYILYPLLIQLNVHNEFGAKDLVAEYLKKINLEKIQVLFLVGVIAGSLCSVFMLMMCLERLIVAMSRDGLLFQFFIKAAHSNDAYVAPSFTIGLLTGIFSMVINSRILQYVFEAAAMITSLLGSIFILNQKYRWSINFQWEYNKRKGLHPWNRQCFVLLTLVVATLGMGTLSCRMVSTMKSYNDFDEFKLTTTNLVVLSIFGLMIVLSFGCLVFGPNNVVAYKNKVWGSPLMQTVSLFLLSFTFSLLHVEVFYILLGWTILGIVVYFFYSIINSKEDF